MVRNSVIVLVIQLFGSGFCQHWNDQWNPPINTTDELTMTLRTAEYECDDKSYFQTIRMSYENNEQVFCDRLTLQESDKSLYAFGFRNGQRLALNQISYVAHMDQNGNEIFWRMGKISGGPCNGDLLFIESYNTATKGSCDLETGITELKSAKTIYAIRGKCESTCFGQSSVKYSPGKRP